jgi:hypothetical protein
VERGGAPPATTAPSSGSPCRTSRTQSSSSFHPLKGGVADGAVGAEGDQAAALRVRGGAHHRRVGVVAVAVRRDRVRRGGLLRPPQLQRVAVAHQGHTSAADSAARSDSTRASRTSPGMSASAAPGSATSAVYGAPIRGAQQIFIPKEPLC